MANVAAAAIFTAIREVIEDATGSIRTIPAARFNGGLYTGLERGAGTFRALAAPIVETEIVSDTRNEATPPVNCSRAIRDLMIEITVVRQIEGPHKLDDDTRDAAKAAAAVDTDLIRQALTLPGNLTQTAAATATNLISGSLIFEEPSETEVQLDGETGGRIVTLHRFKGIADITQATS